MGLISSLRWKREIYKFLVSKIGQFKVPRPKRKSPDIRNRVYFCTLVRWAMLLSYKPVEKQKPFSHRALLLCVRSATLENGHQHENQRVMMELRP